MQDPSMLTEEYLLKRLVYINSASHAYSEIMLDNHMALFGKNNAGKTASLAGTKLLLFPEVDFHHCDNKFKFKGKAGLYSMEQSYDFYFPDARSFIILEVCNPEGVFCMVLYKTNNYGYGRFFIPVEYQHMRSLFWDTEGQQFAEQISLATLSNFAKENGGLQVTERKEITRLMFSSYRDIPARKRFCVLPFKDDRKESTDAFRNIYQLAFETGNLDIKTLPNAIAALLEMGRSRQEERLDANLIELTEQHSQLYQKGEWLQKLSNSTEHYGVVKNKHQAATDTLGAYSKNYYAIQLALNVAKQTHAPRYQALSEQHSVAANERQCVETLRLSNTHKARENKGAAEQINKLLNSKRDALGAAKKLVASYAGMPNTEILDILHEQLDEVECKARDLNDENGLSTILQRNLKARKTLFDTIDKCRELMATSESVLLHQLDDVDAADTLYSINPSFADIKATLTDSDQQTIIAFTRLFKKEPTGALSFLDTALNNSPFKHFNLEQKRGEWEKDLHDARHKLDDLEYEIKRHNDVRTPEQLAALIEQTDQDINAYKADIQAINAIPTLSDDVLNLESELSSNDDAAKDLEAAGARLDEEFTGIYTEWSTLAKALVELKAQQEEFTFIERSLNTAKQSVTPLLVEVAPLPAEQLNQQTVLELIAKSTHYNKIFNDFKSTFDVLARDLPHVDVDHYKELFKLADYDNPINVYDAAFETLDYDLLQQKHAVMSHNQLFNHQISEITESASLLRNFVGEINRDLNEKHISNLSEIKLHLTLNPAFLSLIATLDKHDIQGDSLLEAQVYESLSKFVEKFFNKKSRRLKMADIISEMAYHYRLEETGELVTKGQSGGTTSAITSFVLAVLLKRITPSYVRLQMPIIVDEISTLDSANTDSTIKQITEHGFSIFCATPNYSASVSHKVGRWVMIDKSTIKAPLVQSCHLNILPEQVESFGVKPA